MTEQYGFDMKTQQKARQYLYTGLAVSLGKGMVILVLSVVALSLRLHVALEDIVKTWVMERGQIVALYFLIGYATFWLVTLPFDYLKEYVLEHKFELATEKLGKWFNDKIKMLILYVVFLLFFVEGVYSFMSLSPAYWWFFTWVVSAIFVVLLFYAFPVLIMPMFYKFPRIRDEQLLEKLTHLSEKSGVKVIGIYEMKAGEKTKKAIAALTGIANTRRMLLSDTFLANYTSDEIESVMGHELGHHVYHHIGKATLLTMFFFLVVLVVADQVLRVTMGFFGITEIASVASLPLLGLLFGLIYTVSIPFFNTYSRWQEGQSDQYELDLVDKPDAYISSMTKLCDQNLRYAYPHPLIELMFYDHPSGKKRIKRALEYRERKKQE